MKKVSIILLAALLAVTMVYASGSSETTTTTKKRTVTIWYDGNEAESFARLEPEFEALYP